MIGSALLSLKRNFSQAFRVILKMPLLSTIAVLSLAFGIAANTTVFSVVHSFLLRPLPYVDSGNLVLLWGNPVSRAGNQWQVSPATFADWQRSNQSFEGMSALELTSANLTGRDQPLRVDAAMTSDNFFELIQGHDPLIGRTYRPGDAKPGSEPVVVIKESLWRHHYGAAEDLIGSALMIDGKAHTVIGVMPQAFDFLSGSIDLWAAANFGDVDGDREDRRLTVAGRLKPGVSLEQGRQEMAAISERLAAAFPETQEGWGVYVQTLREMFPGPTDSQLVKVLQAVALLVLLVACVNVASLLLAQADSRQKEMALRTALGAGRNRLLGQLLTESMVLASIAGALGLGLSYFGVQLTSGAMPEMLPSVYWPRFEGPVIVFGLLTSLMAGLAFGLGPASQAIRSQNLRQTLSDGGRGGSVGRDRKRALGLFVVTELALALAILVGAGVLTDLFHNRLGGDPGFEADGVLTAHLTLPEYRYPDDTALMNTVEQLERRFAALGGVESVTLASALPRTQSLSRADMELERRPAERNEAPRVAVLSATPSFFETLQIQHQEGRVLQVTDRPETVPVVVVNQRFVDLHLADAEAGPIGERIVIDEKTWSVVGVVPNFAQERMDGLSPYSALAIMPFSQRPVRDVYPILRALGDPYSLKEGLQEVVKGVAPDQPVGEIVTLTQFTRAQLAGPTVISQILFGIGLLALVLAAIGIYGVMAFRVSRQTTEIGIRLALGARPSQILTQVSTQGLRLAVSGLILGLPIAAVVVSLISKIFEAAQTQGLAVEQSVSMMPMLKVALLLSGVSLLACLLPSLKATKVDPQKALQAE